MTGMKWSVFIFFFSIGPAMADCVSLSGNISWQKIDSNELLLFKGGRPLAKIDLAFGTFLYDSSRVTILDDWSCSYSRNVFLIDGEVVDVRQIDKF